MIDVDEPEIVLRGMDSETAENVRELIAETGIREEVVTVEELVEREEERLRAVYDSTDLTQVEVGEIFGVSQATVSVVLRRGSA